MNNIDESAELAQHLTKIAQDNAAESKKNRQGTRGYNTALNKMHRDIADNYSTLAKHIANKDYEAAKKHYHSMDRVDRKQIFDAPKETHKTFAKHLGIDIKEESKDHTPTINAYVKYIKEHTLK